jgi:hypothetical protein
MRCTKASWASSSALFEKVFYLQTLVSTTHGYTIHIEHCKLQIKLTCGCCNVFFSMSIFHCCNFSLLMNLMGLKPFRLIMVVNQEYSFNIFFKVFFNKLSHNILKKLQNMWKNLEHSLVLTCVIHCLSTSCKGVCKTLNQSHVSIHMEKSAWKRHIKQQFKRVNFELISPSFPKVITYVRHF